MAPADHGGTDTAPGSDPGGLRRFIVGVDPGTSKTGVACVRLDGDLLERRLVPASQLLGVLKQLATRRPVAFAIGDRTGGKALAEALSAALGPHGPAVCLVDEHRSTLEGVALYWRTCPPRGWRRLLPVGLLSPPEPVDAYVAEVLARRYLASLGG